MDDAVLTLHQGANIKVVPRRIRPPYKSSFPPQIPTERAVKKYGKWSKDMPDEEWGRVEIHSSVMGFGDFARYIIGSDFHTLPWSSQRLKGQESPSLKKQYEAFLKSLTSEQRRLLDKYRNVKVPVSSLLDFLPNQASKVVSKADGWKRRSAAQAAFRKSFGKAKRRVYDLVVLPYLSGNAREQQGIDVSIAQRWILNRVFELGWTVERFGHFDRMLNYGEIGRSAHKAERIGKKYQWLAYYEFLARLSDNFAFIGERWGSGNDRVYEGPWQSSRRDIDAKNNDMRIMFFREVLLNGSVGSAGIPDVKLAILRDKFIELLPYRFIKS